jgi:translocation and assembly module TamB
VRVPAGPRLDDVTGHFAITANQIACERLTASVAGGAVRAHGTFRTPGPLLQDWQQGALDLTIDGTDVLLYRGDGVRIRSDVALVASGPPANVTLRGALRLRSSKVVQRIPFFNLGQAGGASVRRGLSFAGPDLGDAVNVRLDVAVTSDEPIEIVTNVVAGAIDAALTVRGTLEAPRPEGTFAMPTGTITLPGCQFRTTNALLTFPRDDPFFPRLDLVAVGRRHGYDVRMVVRGRYDEPEISLSATPSLPAEELAVLVTTGQRPSALRDTRTVGTLLGSYLVQELADELFGSESTEAKESFVSRFEVETGTEISANGTESIVLRFRVADGVFLEGERDVYEDVNFGVVYRIRFK